VEGDRLYFPVPVKLDVCGLLLALSVTLNFPVLVPVSVGVKVTPIVHFALAARLVVHVVAETAKSPVVEIATLVSATLWLLASVNVFAVLVVPTVHGPKETLAGMSVAGSAPVPDKGAVCGLLEALSVKASVPVTLPGTVGVKVILTLHNLPMRSVAPLHVSAEIAKPLPAMVTPLTTSRDVPLFFSPTPLGALVWFKA
jgi:hypothetical protein